VRWFAVVAGLVAVLAVPAVGGAAPPTTTGAVQHERFVDTFEEEDFCGTGETVTVIDRFHTTFFVGESGGDPEQRLRGTYTVRSTFTFGDRSATYHEAGHFTSEIISGLESGVHTHLNVETGLRGAIRGPGGLIVRDAGVIAFEVTFDANDEVTDVQVIDVKGPHDLFDAGDFFCPAVTEALGIG